jgi:hypothetical protein
MGDGSNGHFESDQTDKAKTNCDNLMDLGLVSQNTTVPKHKDSPAHLERKCTKPASGSLRFSHHDASPK